MVCAGAGPQAQWYDVFELTDLEVESLLQAVVDHRTKGRLVVPNGKIKFDG